MELDEGPHPQRVPNAARYGTPGPTRRGPCELKTKTLRDGVAGRGFGGTSILSAWRAETDLVAALLDLHGAENLRLLDFEKCPPNLEILKMAMVSTVAVYDLHSMRPAAKKYHEGNVGTSETCGQQHVKSLGLPRARPVPAFLGRYDEKRPEIGQGVGTPHQVRCSELVFGRAVVPRARFFPLANARTRRSTRSCERTTRLTPARRLAPTWA